MSEFEADTAAEQAAAEAAGWDTTVVGGGQTEWEKAQAFAAERRAAFEALGDLGLVGPGFGEVA